MFDANVERIDIELPIDVQAAIAVFNSMIDESTPENARFFAKDLFLTLKIKDELQLRDRVHAEYAELFEALRQTNQALNLEIVALRAALDQAHPTLVDRAETIANLERQIGCLKTENEELKRGKQSWASTNPI